MIYLRFLVLSIFASTTLLRLSASDTRDNHKIWYHPDSLVAMPIEDSISYMEEYSVYTVVRSTDTATNSLIWGISENNILHSGVLTKGSYSKNVGVLHPRSPRDFSRWCVYAYHSGIRLDSTLQHGLYLGAVDTLPAAIEMEEMTFLPGPITRLQSNAWQSYLAMKYGITLDYAPYIAPSGDTLWHPIQDENYYHRVVAIGSDSLHLWQATRSATKEEATLRIVASKPLNEGQYILLGDDDGPESWSLLFDGRSRLMCTWRIRQHNVVSPFSLAWHPSVEIDFPDSVILSLMDIYDMERQRIHPDSIVGDSVYWFTCPARSEAMMLQISTRQDDDNPSAKANAYYNKSSGMITINTLVPDKIYSYALYSNVGQLLFRPSPSRPDAIRVGNLPVGVYRLEAFENNQMATSVPVIVR